MGLSRDMSRFLRCALSGTSHLDLLYQNFQDRESTNLDFILKPTILLNYSQGLKKNTLLCHSFIHHSSLHPFDIYLLSLGFFLFPLVVLLCHVGSWFPNQGSNPCHLQWKHRVLTTRPLGKCLSLGFYMPDIVFGTGDSHEPVTTFIELRLQCGGKAEKLQLSESEKFQDKTRAGWWKSFSCVYLNFRLLLRPLPDFISPSTERYVEEREKMRQILSGSWITPRVQI